MNYEYEELDEFIVSDYFSKEIRISDLVIDNDLSDYITYYELTDNDKIERISYELYGTPNYWDILILLNSKSPFFDMSFDFDVVYDNSTNFLETYTNIIYSHAILNSVERVTALREEFLNNFIEQNEANRRIVIIKPTKMGDFIKLLKNKKYL